MTQDSAPYRFALLSHSPDIAEYVRSLADPALYDMRFHLVDFETAVPVARECLETGAEVVICHGGTGHTVFQALGQALATVDRSDTDLLNLQALGQSVVTVDRTDMDVIHTLQEARKSGEDIILAVHQGEEHDIPTMETLLGVRIYRVAYTSSKGMFEAIRRYYARGVRLLAGGGVSARYMEQLGGTGFVVMPSRESVERAFVLARTRARQKRQQNALYASLQTKGFVARYDLAAIKGDSAQVAALKEKIRRFAPSGAAVLIQGETGTGKELVAHALHTQSDRAIRPFVAVNFASIPENLVESELFGYEEGAFTGARRGGKPGFFELAHTGTLFLDEVGEISHEMQIRLLRVLEAKEVMRVAGNRFIPVDVRVVSASHQPLAQMVAGKKFRQDLYYRLSTLKLQVPPLRDRLDDAGILIRRLLPRYGKSEAVIDATTMNLIRSWSWPGNIRELLAVMESYLIQLNGDTADPELFAAILRENNVTALPATPTTDFVPGISLQDALHDARLAIIEAAVRHHGGDRRAAAKALHVSYSTLWRIQQEKR